MELLDVWEEPRSLIPQILQHLNPTEDLAMASEIEETIRSLQIQRAAERESTLQDIERTLMQAIRAYLCDRT